MTTLREFLARVQMERDMVVGQVANVVRDSTTGRQVRARVSLGENTIDVALDAQAPELAPADYVRLENYGSSTLADWRVVGAFGARPAAGVLQFLDTTAVGGQVYAPGDILIGGTGSGSPNWWFEYATGTWRRRVGTRVLGLDEASGRSIWGPPDGVHWELDPDRNTLAVKNGERPLYTFDGDTGYITGWQGLGRPLGPGIRWGEIARLDADGNPVLDAAGQPITRYAWRVIGLNGVPVVSILSGDQGNPNEAYLRIGAPGATRYLEYAPETGLRLNADSIQVGDATGLNADTVDGEHAFELLRTDGTRPLTGDLDFASYRAVAMACDNGTSFPASPTAGQWFYHITSTILFQYDGTTWRPLIAFGDVHLYVDGTNGVDDWDHGWSSAAATQTINAALYRVPPQQASSYAVYVHVAAGTYNEALINPTTAATIYLIGAYTVLASGVVASSYRTQGTTQSGTATASGTTVTISGGNTNNCAPGMIFYAANDRSQAAQIVSVDSSTQLTLDRSLSLTAAAWGIAGCWVGDASATWNDGDYDSDCFVVINPSPGDSYAADAAKMYPIYRTWGSGQRLVVLPYITQTPATYEVRRLDTIITRAWLPTNANYNAIFAYYTKFSVTATDTLNIGSAWERPFHLRSCVLHSTVENNISTFIGILTAYNCRIVGVSPVVCINVYYSYIDLRYCEIVGGNLGSSAPLTAAASQVLTIHNAFLLSLSSAAEANLSFAGQSIWRQTSDNIYYNKANLSVPAAVIKDVSSTSLHTATHLTRYYGFSETVRVNSQTYGSHNVLPLVQRFPEATAPATRTDEAQIWAQNQNSEAGNEALHILSESGHIYAFGNRLAAGGGLQQAIRTVTSNTTATVADRYICGNAAGGSLTITLPSPAGAYSSSLAVGSVLTIKKTDDSANHVVVSGTLEGGSRLTLSVPQSAVTLISDGTYWRVVDVYQPVVRNVTALQQLLAPGPTALPSAHAVHAALLQADNRPRFHIGSKAPTQPRVGDLWLDIT